MPDPKSMYVVFAKYIALQDLTPNRVSPLTMSFCIPAGIFCNRNRPAASEVTRLAPMFTLTFGIGASVSAVRNWPLTDVCPPLASTVRLRGQT